MDACILRIQRSGQHLVVEGMQWFTPRASFSASGETNWGALISGVAL